MPELIQHIPAIRADFGENQYAVLWSLYGSMIGEENAVAKMGEFVVDPSMLPREKDGHETMEARFLRIFYAITGDRDPALHDQKGDVVITRDDMVQGLTIEVGKKKAVEFVDRMVNRKPDYGANVHHSAAMLSDWIASRRGAVAAMKAQAVFDGRLGTLDDQWYAAMKIMESAAPRPPKSDDLLGSDGIAMWEKVYQRRLDLAEQGRTIGPRLPWGLDRKVRMLKKGELCTIAAKSSMGKSTVALLLGHEIAHEQQGYDVLYLYMETRTESQFDRLIASGVGVTTQDLQDPVDEKDDKGNVTREGFNLYENKKAFEKFTTWASNYRRKQETNGRVWFCHAPGITGIEVRNKIAMYKALAEAKGRELVVIVDYYSLLASAGIIESTAPGWAQNDAKADSFKEQAEQYEIYMVTFAQDNMEADYTDHNRKTTKNGSLIYERSQVVIRIMREWAKDDKPYLDSNGKQKLDLAGRPMFLHEKDQPSSDARLVVEKASDGAVGPVNVMFFGSYFRIAAQSRAVEPEKTGKPRTQLKPKKLDEGQPPYEEAFDE